MVPDTMVTVIKNKHSGNIYFFLRQNKQSKKVSSKSVTMREQPCFMVTENIMIIMAVLRLLLIGIVCTH